LFLLSPFVNQKRRHLLIRRQPNALVMGTCVFRANAKLQTTVEKGTDILIFKLVKKRSILGVPKVKVSANKAN